VSKSTKVGIIICDRYSDCAGGKCFRALQKKEGAFADYKGELELVGYTTCQGCPGGNVEKAPEEMAENGVDVIHLATGMLVGYPPCPRINYFKNFIEKKYDVEVKIGTHPIPQKYYKVHDRLKTWSSSRWDSLLNATLADKEKRLEYD